MNKQFTERETISTRMKNVQPQKNVNWNKTILFSPIRVAKILEFSKIRS